ncbi:hypothetical protein JTB14_024144 [Gonioctena quinquepunctata]|nr:hypothetical protein JTB14_024144 [Gonioctena quinquepunctata]
MDTNWSFLDFPYICRICCSRKKLELFECHGSLLELFNNITNISVEPTDLLPKNVCNNCIRKLQEMSKFIEDSKYIDLQLKQEVAKQDNFICKQENIFIMDNSSEIVIKREEEQIEFFNAPEDSGLVGEPEDLNYLDYKINIKELEQYNQCNIQIKSEIVIDEPLSKPENRVDSLRDKMRPYNCEICFKGASKHDKNSIAIEMFARKQ